MKKAHTGILHLSTDQRVMSDSIEKLVLPSWTVISRYIYFFKETKDLHNYRNCNVSARKTLRFDTRKKLKITNL